MLNKTDKIREQILKKYKLKSCDKINYELLHRIYSEYEKYFDEKTFAKDVLDINYESYCQIKYNPKKRAIILRNNRPDIEKIRIEIFKKFKLKPGDKINYQRLKEIEKEYSTIIDERTIAYEILGISKMMLYPIKQNSNYSTTILPEEYERKIKEIKDKVIQNLNLLPDDGMIDYKKLSELALQFNIDEKDFATQVLEIEKYNFDNIKHDENRRTRIILKAKFNKDKTKAAGQVDKRKQKYLELDELRKKVITNEKLKIGSTINYNTLHEIYLKYQSETTMSESAFALYMMDIKETRFWNLKSNRNQNAVILKDMINGVVNKLIVKLQEDENLFPGDTINYERLERLIQKYGGVLDEKILLRKVLDISAEKFKEMQKNPNRQTQIMKSRIKREPEDEIKTSQKEQLISVEEIKKIRQEIYSLYNLKEGDKVNYEFVSKIFEEYKQLFKRESEFATRVLGVSGKSYYIIKYDRKKKTQLFNPDIREKADKIRYLVEQENRFYTIEEIENLCRDYNISIDEFCSYVVQRQIHKKIYTENNFYKEILEKNGKIFIGRNVRLSESFAREYQNEIIDFSRSLAVKFCQKYNEINNINDYAQDTMVYIIEHCGDLERNFKDNIDLCKALIYKRAEAFIKGKILFGKKRRTISIDSYYTDRKDNSLIINDKTQDTERKAISALEKNYTESDLLTRVLEYINYGKTPIEAINLVADQNNVDMEELTQSIKEIYSKRSRVKAEEER